MSNTPYAVILSAEGPAYDEHAYAEEQQANACPDYRPEPNGAEVVITTGLNAVGFLANLVASAFPGPR